MPSRNEYNNLTIADVQSAHKLGEYKEWDYTTLLSAVEYSKTFSTKASKEVRECFYFLMRMISTGQKYIRVGEFWVSVDENYQMSGVLDRTEYFGNEEVAEEVSEMEEINETV